MARSDTTTAATPALPFLCECGNSLCCARIWLTPEEYEEHVRGAHEPLLAPRHDSRQPPDE